MSSLNDDLRNIILRALPSISKHTQEALIDVLVSSGLVSTQDLKYVTQEDISDLLPPIQQRKLLDAFKNGNLEKNVASILQFTVNF